MITSKKALDNLSYKIIGAAIEVHRHLGPGLLESVYQKCLAIEFKNQEIIFRQELKVPLEYKG
jgi:GxxExxY protein